MLRYFVRKRRLPYSRHPTISFGSSWFATGGSASCQQQQQQNVFRAQEGMYTSAVIFQQQQRPHQYRSLVSVTHPLDNAALSTAPANRQSGEGYHALLRWTEAALHPTKAPLGSLSVASWKDYFMAMQVWLGHVPTTSAAENKIFAEELVPRHVDWVDRLLVRLLYEHSTHTNRTTARWQQQDEQLQMWTRVTLQSWLQVSASFPDSPMAVNKASQWWQTLQRKWGVEDVGIPVFIDLVHAHQRLVDTTGVNATRCQACQQAVDMLLADATLRNIVPNCGDEMAGQLKACYQLALRQALELIPTESKSGLNEATTTDFAATASDVMQQIEQLALIPGWDDVRFKDEELDRVLDTLFLDGIKDSRETKKKALSSFERQALQQRILTRIDQASSVADQDAVEELILYWRSNMQGTEKETKQWQPLAKAVTNFYLRIQDPVKSTTWMQIQDQMPSVEAVTEAIRSVRTSTAAHDGAVGAETSNFQELENLSRVFAENRQERINQKLNLLDIWVTKVDSPIVPWRATEILESLEAEEGTLLGSHIYLTVVKLWIDISTSATGVASQKAVDIAMRCPSFDTEILSLVMKHLVSRQNAGIPAPSVALKLIDLLEKKVDQFTPRALDSLMKNAFQLVSKPERSQQLLKHLINSGSPISAETCEAAINSYPGNAATLIDLKSNRDSAVECSFEFYRPAIKHLLSRQRDPQNIYRIQRLVSDALNLADGDFIEGRVNELVDMVYDILGHLSTKDATVVWNMFVETEDVLFKRPDLGTTVSTPISMDFYRKVVTLLAYKQMHEQVEQVFDRLKQHYAAGFIDLHPDGTIYAVYSMILKKRDGLNSLDKRIELLNELVELYEVSNRKIDHYKPTYILFHNNVVDLHERTKSINKAVAYSVDPYEKDSRAAVSLLEKMHILRVAPHDQRAYAFNVTMNLVLKCRNKFMHFKVVIALKEMMTDLQIKPNFYTWLGVLRACQRAAPPRNLTALTVMLDVLADIRKHGMADGFVYIECFQVLEANQRQLKRQGEGRDNFVKILATVFQCCCDDGVLTNTARNQFRTLASPNMYQELYLSHLLDGTNVPDAWTRKSLRNSTRAKDEQKAEVSI